MRQRLRLLLQQQVRAALAPRAAELERAGDALALAAERRREVERRLLGLERSVVRLTGDCGLLSRPFSAEMTIDQAWRRHPAARRIFAAHHLPGCGGCAVRYDETLAEAAAAYDLDLAALLAALNALL